MKHSLIVSAALLTLATFSLSAQTQAKSDNEAVALIAKAKQQEQKIVRGRLKVREQSERLSPDSGAERIRYEQGMIKAGADKKEAAQAARDFYNESSNQTKIPLHEYNFAFDAAKQVHLQEGIQFGRHYRKAMTGQERISADAYTSSEMESSAVVIWRFDLNRYPSPYLVGMRETFWMSREWEAFAHEGSPEDIRLLEKKEDGTAILVRSFKSTNAENATDVKVWMDTKHGYTLTRMQYIFRKTGHVYREMVYSYDRREDGTYYPKEAVQTDFHEDDAGKWVARGKTTASVEKVEINIPIPQNELEIEIPNGALVRDLRYSNISINYRQGEKPPRNSRQ